MAPSAAWCDPAPVATPRAPSATVSAEDEFSPNYQSETGSSNVVDLRAQIPYDNAAWVVRLKLPIVTAAPAESITGAGDLALWDLAVVGAGYGQWLVGGTLRVPTAHDSLGTNKYSIGPSGGYVVERGAATMGFFANSFFSVIGPSWYPAVAKTQIAPAFKYNLRDGWNVGLSTMQFTYDWVRNRWTEVPLGVRIGAKDLFAMKPLDGFLEVEQNLAHAPDSPGWTIRALLRWTLSGSEDVPSDENADQ